ncbi:hypothetical protein Tco_1007105 [Tanacetum coccineum]
MKDLGFAKQILGMSIMRDKTKGTLTLSQEKYISKVLEKFRSNPGREHYEAVKWLLHYRKVGGTKVSWMSRFQKSVAMSTIKAEYMAIVEAGKELRVSYVRRYRRLALALLKGRWFEVYKRLVETKSIDVISLQEFTYAEVPWDPTLK